MEKHPVLNDEDLCILRAIVTDAVQASRGTLERYNYQLLDRLRRYERTAVAIGLEAQTIQVIRFGRRMIGDLAVLVDGRFIS